MVVAYLETSYFVDPPGSVYILDHLFAGQIALRDVKEIAKGVFAELKINFLRFLCLKSRGVLIPFDKTALL